MGLEKYCRKGRQTALMRCPDLLLKPKSSMECSGPRNTVPIWRRFGPLSISSNLRSICDTLVWPPRSCAALWAHLTGTFSPPCDRISLACGFAMQACVVFDDGFSTSSITLRCNSVSLLLSTSFSNTVSLFDLAISHLLVYFPCLRLHWERPPSDRFPTVRLVRWKT